MDFPMEPEEPTSVVRMMEDFKTFSKAGRSRRQPNRNTSGMLLKSDSLSSEVENSMDNSAFNLTRDRKKDVELLTTKAKLVVLEEKLKHIETDRKRGMIELENDRNEKQRKIAKLGEEKKELHRELDLILEKEEAAREEAECQQKTFDRLQKQYNSEIDMLKAKNSEYLKQIDELKEIHKKEVDGLVAKINQNEVIFYKNKAEENEAHIELLRSKLARHAGVIKENEKLAARLRDSEYKCRVAEEAISRQEEAFVIAKTMQEKVKKFKQLEMQNEKLKEENQLLKDTRDNVALVTHKYETMKVKYEDAVTKIHSLSLLEAENEELKKKINKWEVQDTSTGEIAPRSPLELTRMISTLQKSQLSMVEKQGSLQASCAVKETSLQKLKEKYEELRERFIQLEEKERQQGDKCQRLQRRLQLVTADRDSIRRILNNFDSGMLSVQSNQLRNRVEEAEHQLAAANDLIVTIENESDALRKELSSYRLLSTKLQHEVDDLKSQRLSADKDASMSEILKKEVSELTTKNNKLQEQIEVLEARIEQRHLQGDFDPTKTKVLHFARNPLALSRKLHAQELDNLRDENEDLRRKIKILEQNGAEHLTTKSEGTDITADDTKQVQELKSLLESSELRSIRLKEVFEGTAQKFRESCYQLFGYKSKMIGQSTFQLFPMYAERPDDFFIFEIASDKQLEMKDTEFSHQFEDAMDFYLQRGASIPAFLSSVTLELFKNQTQIVDSSLYSDKGKR